MLRLHFMLLSVLIENGLWGGMGGEPRGRGRQSHWCMSRREVMVTEEMGEWTDLGYILEVTLAGLADGLPVRVRL